MRSAALATGIGVPAMDFAGRVAEVHRRAALLKISGRQYITLLGSELGRQPRGISLDLPDNMSLQQFLSINAEVGTRGGVVRFAGSEFSIDLRNARPWRSGVSQLNFDLRNPAVARTYRAVSLALERDGRAQAFRNMAGAKLDRLSAALGTRDIAAAERAISDLIGLGEGKTPAGDDYLVGVCAALWSCADSRAFAVALRPVLVALAGGTSDLSGLYLQEAAGGEVSERLEDVAAGICAGGSDDDVGDTVARALSVGHSSGAAGIFGLLQGYADCTAAFQASAVSVLAPAF